MVLFQIFTSVIFILSIVAFIWHYEKRIKPVYEERKRLDDAELKRLEAEKADLENNIFKSVLMQTAQPSLSSNNTDFYLSYMNTIKTMKLDDATLQRELRAAKFMLQFAAKFQNEFNK